MTEGYETVYTVTDYYDGPRAGLTSFRGGPHIYQSVFPDFQDVSEESNDADDVFYLQPINEETFRLAMEAWAIWCRWERAFRNGETSSDTHPALPEDHARHVELAKVLAESLRIDPSKAFKLKGKFGVRTPAQEPGLSSSCEIIVQWMPLKAV